MRYFILLITLSSLLSCTKQELEISQWRGPNRDGIYHESNLLKQWPTEGPQLLWDVDFVGDGYGSPIVTKDKIFVNGAIDSIAYLFALDLNGELLWKSEFGKEWIKNFPGSRSAPTAYNKMVYVCSGMGDIACFNITTGEKLWHQNMISDLHGENNVFGYSQSLLVDDENVYCSPGGKDTNVVALNRLTGDLVWHNSALGQISAFCSPMIYSYAGFKMLLTYSENALLALDSTTGELLWTYANDTTGNVHSNIPLLNKNNLYLVDGDGNNAVKLELSDDGRSVKELWRNNRMDNIMGGMIKTGNHLIATGHYRKVLKSLNMNTGDLTDSLNIGRGSTIYADSMIYVYNERGQVHLVKEEDGFLTPISHFKISKGSKQHFSHPVIKNGVLYVRRGKGLMAYNIRANKMN